MAQHSHPPRRVAQSPKQNTFFGGAAVLAAGILVVKLIGLFYKIPFWALPAAARRRCSTSLASRGPQTSATPITSTPCCLPSPPRDCRWRYPSW